LHPERTDLYCNVHHELYAHQSDLGGEYATRWKNPQVYTPDMCQTRQVGNRFRIECLLILSDELWPCEEPLSASSIRSWIDEQYHVGIRL